MLIDDVERYIALRRSLGFQLQKPARHLQAFARVAAEKGETHICAATVITWAAAAPTLDARNRRIGDVGRFARFLRAEDDKHEMPPTGLFATPKVRPAPYIYSPEELARMLEAAGRLRMLKPNPLRRQLYMVLFGLIAATGLRVSEALNLRLGDVLPGGVLQIRETKFYKSRLVPLHATVVEVLDRYLDMRRRSAGSDDHLFLLMEGAALAYSTARCAFRRILQLADIAPGRARRPRIHDLRHSFATRVLEQCGTKRDEVARHFVALRLISATPILRTPTGTLRRRRN
ncbi:tyrosine-type recombinase/integrase [Bradyrhizobium yuanmingense]|uniref:tyrosine-type recombinase/integrase n=1 Tax=Bradyrhizobium yuanmingense TaxID=108015 RepID=UPI001CD63C5B|nr:tyrosine-type recombinase/integrase [Bradyrhizobium yuanmingense]